MEKCTMIEKDTKRLRNLAGKYAECAFGKCKTHERFYDGS
jgi:hypothetical protein